MRKPASAKQLAIDILERSTCAVQVGAAIEDSRGILSWGWNSVGDGFGLHAEMHAIRRANKKRLVGATIYVASKRRRNRKIITSRPCLLCLPIVRDWELKIVWRDADGKWINE